MWVSTLHNVGVHTADVDAESVMHPGVGHDVVNWASVEVDLFAHKRAFRFLRAGFGELASTD